jgi:hypothetical protein
MNINMAAILLTTIAGLAMAGGKVDPMQEFDTTKDLLSLHYDHAPDKDDGHSAAADRSMLQTLYSEDWIREHVIAVSGVYGKNARMFNPDSDLVMDAVWNDLGGWLGAHTNREDVIVALVHRWGKVIGDGGSVWIKEGGQSDISAEVVRRIQEQDAALDTKQHIHLVQHSNWNENQTTDSALAYVKKHTNYIRIRDANAYLNVKGGHAEFEKAALAHPKFGSSWQAAFAYYHPKVRLDFSDTGELMHILGLGEIGIEAFMQRYLMDAQPESHE